VNDDGFEIARHDFALTEEGRCIAKEKASNNPKVWRRIEDAVRQFNSAGKIDYMKMSVAAKTFFMLSNSRKPATPCELSESAKALGWSPSAKEIADSVEFLKKLGLASSVSPK